MVQPYKIAIYRTKPTTLLEGMDEHFSTGEILLTILKAIKNAPKDRPLEVRLVGCRKMVHLRGYIRDWRPDATIVDDPADLLEDPNRKFGVFYHANCNDGLAAAATIYRKWGDVEVEYHPIQYSSTVEVDSFLERWGSVLLGLKGALFLDFCPSSAVLEMLLKRMPVVIADHHKTANEMLFSKFVVGGTNREGQVLTPAMVRTVTNGCLGYVLCTDNGTSGTGLAYLLSATFSNPISMFQDLVDEPVTQEFKFFYRGLPSLDSDPSDKAAVLHNLGKALESNLSSVLYDVPPYLAGIIIRDVWDTRSPGAKVWADTVAAWISLHVKDLESMSEFIARRNVSKWPDVQSRLNVNYQAHYINSEQLVKSGHKSTVGGVRLLVAVPGAAPISTAGEIWYSATPDTPSVAVFVYPPHTSDKPYRLSARSNAAALEEGVSAKILMETICESGGGHDSSAGGSLDIELSSAGLPRIISFIESTLKILSGK